ncbi:hypothetical protein CRENBAI_010593 [Crenichthys baileyi]|uniref:Uncharacterized protein n=1 Tax=Crenichthys baileyi TaxID=28760 RepID=A0AAV9RAM8_9TELE
MFCLDDCNLSENCCKLLASALSSTSSQLTDLDLSDNTLRDSGVKLLSDGLRSPQCKLKSLRLHKCKVQGGCCEALALALNTESTQLRVLDLSANVLQEEGVMALSLGLCGHHCKVDTLSYHSILIPQFLSPGLHTCYHFQLITCLPPSLVHTPTPSVYLLTRWTTCLLNQCKLGESCCAALASIFKSGSSQLKILDLSLNNLKDAGVALLVAGLTSPNCKLQILRLSWCGLTQKSCSYISSTLSTDFCQHCKLETLNLQKCCADIALVLNTNNAHLKELDLSGNDIEDLEVELLSNGIANPNCTLETLRLSLCSITVKGCSHVASALSSNPSHMRLLELSYNYLQDSGVNLISVQCINPLCKLEHLSVDHNEECYLKSTLKNSTDRCTFSVGVCCYVCDLQQ